MLPHTVRGTQLTLCVAAILSACRYLECFADGGKLQLVMEWADGGDLDR
jgi:hypothetical protein